MKKAVVFMLALAFIYACGGGGGGDSGGGDSGNIPTSTDPPVAIFDEAKFDAGYVFDD